MYSKLLLEIAIVLVNLGLVGTLVLILRLVQERVVQIRVITLVFLRITLHTSKVVAVSIILAADRRSKVQAVILVGRLGHWRWGRDCCAQFR